jgi:serine phosphatase RsbU (regulator of sigma subunit)
VNNSFNYRLLAVIAFLIISPEASCQKPVLAAKEKKEVAIAKELLSQQKKLLYSSRFDSSISVGRKALRYCEKKKIITVKANVLYYLSTAFSYSGISDSAIFFAKRALKTDMETGDSSHISGSNNLLGSIYKDRHDHKIALDYFIKAYGIAQRNFDSLNMVSSGINIGTLFISLRNYNKAKLYMKEAAEIAILVHDTANYGAVLNNLAIIYESINDTATALNYFRKGLHWYKSINNIDGAANIMNSMASIYYYRAEFDSCMYFVKTSIDMYLELGDTVNASSKIMNYASLLLSLGKTEEAYQVLTKFKRFILQFYEIGAIINYYRIYAEVMVKKGDYKSAFQTQLYLMNLKDSVSDATNSQLVIENEAKFNNAKQRLDNLRLSKDKEISDQKNAKLLVYLVAGIIITGILLLVVFLFFRANRNKQKSNLKLQALNNRLEIVNADIERQKLVVEEKNKEITDSINYAKRIQTALLPSEESIAALFNQYFILYRPKDIVAGDFYWMEAIEKGNSKIILLAVADCTGHGVPGAIVSVICHNALNRCVREFEITDPGELLNKTRELVVAEFEKSHQDVKDGMDISLLKFEFLSNKIDNCQWAGANNPVWILRNQQLLEIKGDKQPIGKYANSSSFTTHTINISDNDHLYLFSDGFADQFGGEHNKKIKSSVFKKLIIDTGLESLALQKEHLIDYFVKWQGAHEQNDDVCIIGIKF